MHYVALATDYDGTIAHDGIVDEPTFAALERLRAGGRRLILVTGRELPDLQRVLPRLDLFDRIVVENGALLYTPETRTERLLGDPPPQAFVDRLRDAGVSPLSIGKVIVATWEPNETVVLDAVRTLGLELQIIFNKGAVMVLPPGVNKRTGLLAALEDLELSPCNCIAVGDAENDFAFLDASGLPVAVANALPMLKEVAVLVTDGARGEGAAELIDRLLATDLAELDADSPRQRVVLARPRDPAQPELTIAPHREAMLLAGASGGGKSTLTTGLLERLHDGGFQTCVLDPEGDYDALEHTVSIGTPREPPQVETVLELLRKGTAVAVNMLGVKLSDRPAFLSAFLPALLALRARTGRPHMIVVDEAHHMLPAEFDPGAAAMPEGLAGMMFVTVRPEALSPRVLDCIDRMIAVGSETRAALAVFCKARGLPIPEMDEALPTGVMASLTLAAPQAALYDVVPGVSARRRHFRKYAEGKLGDDKSFFFRGPENVLNLRAANLTTFVDLADGVDSATWEFHRRRGDFSSWIETSIKDRDLAAEVGRLAEGELPTSEARDAIRAAIERRYTLPG